MALNIIQNLGYIASYIAFSIHYSTQPKALTLEQLCRIYPASLIAKLRLFANGIEFGTDEIECVLEILEGGLSVSPLLSYTWVLDSADMDFELRLLMHEKDDDETTCAWDNVQLTLKQQGKTRTVYVPKDLKEEVEASIREHRRIRTLLQEITQLELALIRSHVADNRRRGKRP